MTAGETKSKLPWFKIALGLVIVAAVGYAAMNSTKTGELLGSLKKKPAAVEEKKAALIELVDDKDDTVRLTQEDSAQILGLRIVDVEAASGPQPLRLPGTLFLDPNKLVHVHSRFGGEAISIGTTEDESLDEAKVAAAAAGGVKTEAAKTGEATPGDGKTETSKKRMRPLQYGDRVKKGQILAIVWSKEIGEKKSELLDASSKLEASKVNLARLESLAAGIVTERTMVEARREVESNLIAVAKAERTLRSWRMTDEEIVAIHNELKAIKNAQQSGNPQIEKQWAEIEVRAAIDGVIVEKSFNVGDMVEPNDDLFKIADLSRLQVLANIYEEDLWAIRALKPESRRWSIDLKSDPTDNQIPGTFDLIGSVIDPAQRTGVVMGWLDNKDGNLTVGQFITATIELPHDPNILAIPESALIEEGDSSTVFVEVDKARREFARRKVKVVRRSAGTIYVDSSPGGNDGRLQPGTRVVVSGVLGLGGELAILRTNSSKRG